MIVNHDIETAFKPLKDHLFSKYSEKLATNLLEQYMYMSEDSEKTFYKHYAARSYFNVFKDGTTEGILQNWNIY